MVQQLALTLILSVFFGASAHAEVRYAEDAPPPATGWESALKFFSRTPASGSVSAAASGSGDIGGSAFFLDQSFYVNNKYLSDGVPDPRFGFNAGYEWDQSWYGSGLYINYVTFEKNGAQAEKFSVAGGFYYPRIESGFPLYARANVGLGYFTNDLDNKGMTFDYNAGIGIRFYSSSRWLFNLEVGSRNYTRLLKSESAQSIIVGSGLAFTF